MLGYGPEEEKMTKYREEKRERSNIIKSEVNEETRVSDESGGDGGVKERR